MRIFWQGFDKVVDWMLYLSGAIIAFVTIAVCYSVVMRYFFKQPPIWVVQTCEYSLLWLVFLGTTWLLREKGHVAVDIIYSRLDKKKRAWVNCFTFFGAMLVCLIAGIIGFDYTLECIQKNVMDVRAVRVPKYIVFLIIPVGMSFLSLQLFRMWWSEFGKLRRKV